MYSRVFKNKEFSSHQELTTYFASKGNCDVVNVVEYQGKWLAFFYERYTYYDTPQRTIETEDINQLSYKELNELGLLGGFPF